MNKLFENVCHEGGCSSASLAVRSNLLATCGRDRCVKIWNTNIGAPDALVKKLETTASPECVHFSHDEHHMTYGSISGAIKLVDVAAGKEMRTLSGHRGKVFLVCQSPKSIYTWASGSLDNTIILWDIRQHPAAVATFRHHSKAVCALQFSPDASWLASGAEDCKVKLVDVRAGGQGLLADLVGHSGSITDVRFHPSDYLLASGSTDKTVRFWDLETYECVTLSQPATSAVRKIRFSRDGGALFAATERDARAIQWEPFDLLGQAPFPLDAVNTFDCAATEDGLRIVAALPASLAVLDAHIELLLTLPSSAENSDGGRASVEPEPDHDPSPFTDSLIASTIRTPSFARSGKVRRSFHAAQLPVETTSSSAAEESSCESGATTSAETSPVHEAMPIRRRNSKTRTKSLSSPSKSPAARPSHPSYPLDYSADEAFKKRDKLPRSRPQSPPPMQFDCPPSEEVFAVSVVSTGKGSGTTSSTTTKTSKSRTVERQSSTGKTVERKSSLTRGSTNNGRVSGGNKSTTKTVVAVEPLGRKVEKVSPLPRSGISPVPNIPGQVDRRDSLKPDSKPLVAITPATPNSNHGAGGSCVDPTEFLPMQLSDRSLGALRLTASPLAAATAALSERDCLSGISKDAQTMHVVMQHRANAIHALRQTWKSGGLQRAVDVALQTNDQTLIVELLNTLNSRSLWSLQLCALLLPEIGKLLESKHEVYVQTAVHSLRVIVGGYGEIIRNGVTRTSSIGVDVLREERYEKCKRCHSQLMAIRSLAGSNAKLGRHSSAYREVGVLMQLFDAPV